MIYLLVPFDVDLIKHGTEHCDILCVKAIAIRYHLWYVIAIPIQLWCIVINYFLSKRMLFVICSILLSAICYLLL